MARYTLVIDITEDTSTRERDVYVGLHDTAKPMENGVTDLHYATSRSMSFTEEDIVCEISTRLADLIRNEES